MLLDTDKEQDPELTKVDFVLIFSQSLICWSGTERFTAGCLAICLEETENTQETNEMENRTWWVVAITIAVTHQ